MTRRQHLILEEITQALAYIFVFAVLISLWLYSLMNFTKTLPKYLFIGSVILLVVSTVTYWISRLIREHKF